jgi:hypothetical protein
MTHPHLTLYTRCVSWGSPCIQAFTTHQPGDPMKVLLIMDKGATKVALQLLTRVALQFSACWVIASTLGKTGNSTRRYDHKRPKINWTIFAILFSTRYPRLAIARWVSAKVPWAPTTVWLNPRSVRVAIKCQVVSDQHASPVRLASSA